LYFYGFFWDGIHLALAGENSTLSLAITTLGGLKLKNPEISIGGINGGSLQCSYSRVVIVTQSMACLRFRLA
jgi:hypothetical protein